MLQLSDVDGDVPRDDKFWRLLALTSPELGKVALALRKIPPTEAACERSFSAHSLLLGDLRQSLSSETAEALLFVRMNSRLLFNIPS